MSYEYSQGDSGSLRVNVVSARAAAHYDYNLGPNDQHIRYVLENHRKQLQIGGEPCYILRRRQSGSYVQDHEISIWELWEGEDGVERYRALVWDGLGMYPDFRSYTPDSEDNVPFSLTISGSILTRVDDYQDLIADDEFALYQDRSVDPNRWYVILNDGYDPTSYTSTYSYSTMAAGVDPTSITSDKEDPEYYGSKYGWFQLTSPATRFTSVNQFLIRLPLTVIDKQPSTAGIVVIDERKAWMLGQPFIDDRDVIVRPAIPDAGLSEQRYEVVNVSRSITKSMSNPRLFVQLHQKFDVKRLEEDDPIYDIPLITE